MIDHKWFSVSRKGWGWFKVRVFQDRRDLTEVWLAKNPGVAVPWAWCDPLEWPRGHYLGELVIELGLPESIVVHETFHIACASWRRYRTDRISIGPRVRSRGPEDRDGRGEEAFAYLLEDFTQWVIDGCKALGMFR